MGRWKKDAILACNLSIRDECKVYGIYGYRRNELELNLLSYDKETNTYVSENLDCNAGPTNALAFKDQGVQKIFVSNRETDEIALYTIEE